MAVKRRTDADSARADGVAMNGLVMVAGTHLQHENGTLDGAVYLQVTQHHDAVYDEGQATLFLAAEVRTCFFSQEQRRNAFSTESVHHACVDRAKLMCIAG